jgi:hypothetical protein
MITNKLLSLVVAALIAVGAVANTTNAATHAERAAERAELAAKVKASIARLGTGADARVDLRRRDGSRVVGYVTEAQDTAFLVRDSSSIVTQVPYDDVTKVKAHNLATGWKIAIGAGAIFAILLILVWSGAIGDAER